MWDKRQGPEQSQSGRADPDGDAKPKGTGGVVPAEHEEPGLYQRGNGGNQIQASGIPADQSKVVVGLGETASKGEKW